MAYDAYEEEKKSLAQSIVGKQLEKEPIKLDSEDLYSLDDGEELLSKDRADKAAHEAELAKNARDRNEEERKLKLKYYDDNGGYALDAARGLGRAYDSALLTVPEPLKPYKNFEKYILDPDGELATPDNETDHTVVREGVPVAASLAGGGVASKLAQRAAAEEIAPNLLKVRTGIVGTGEGGIPRFSKTAETLPPPPKTVPAPPPDIPLPTKESLRPIEIPKPGKMPSVASVTYKPPETIEERFAEMMRNAIRRARENKPQGE